MKDYIMPFGKYKNESINDIPRSYLNWLLEQDWVYEDKWKKLIEAIEDNITIRDRSYDTY